MKATANEKYDVRNEADLARLPVWAQAQVRALIRDLDGARAILAAGPEDSDTVVEGSLRYGSPPRPLAKHPTIRFGDFYEARYNAEDDSLNVWGESRIVILPEVTNSVSIKRG